MKQEHCDQYGHAEPFTTSNYGLETTPEDEYKIATGQKACPEEAKKDKQGKTVRVVKSLAELKALAVVLQAKLTDMEIIAVVRAAPCSALARLAPAPVLCRSEINHSL